MPRFKASDKVKVREHISSGNTYNEFISTSEEQSEYAGQVVTIDTYYPEFDGYVILEDDGLFLWHDDMLEAMP